MKTSISSTTAARHLGDLLARIKHTGDSFILMKNRKPVAELGPVPGARSGTLRELWDAMLEVKADSGFAADLDRVNRADRQLEDPWA